MTNILSTLIEFPQGSGFKSLIYGLLGALYNLFDSYGLAIIVFAIVLRIVMFPIDYINKYFSKKNARKMAQLKPELEALRSRYKDALSLNRAQQEVYRRNGYSPGGMCLVLIVNIALSLFVFLSVLSALRSVSNYNVYLQYVGTDNEEGLYSVYEYFESENKVVINEGVVEFTDPSYEQEFIDAVNEVYHEIKVTFAWVDNMWRPDSLVNQMPSYAQFKSSARSYFDKGEFASWDEFDAYHKPIYEATKNAVNENNRANGLLILVLLAGVITYVSTLINAKATQVKRDEQKSSQESVVQYSMRKTKDAQTESAIPDVNPAAAANIMKVLLPIMMVYFALSNTAAFAIYIVVGSAATTALSLGSNYIVERQLKKQDERESAKQTEIINPHAKYFKKK